MSARQSIDSVLASYGWALLADGLADVWVELSDITNRTRARSVYGRIFARCRSRRLSAEIQHNTRLDTEDSRFVLDCQQKPAWTAAMTALRRQRTNRAVVTFCLP